MAEFFLGPSVQRVAATSSAVTPIRTGVEPQPRRRAISTIAPLLPQTQQLLREITPVRPGRLSTYRRRSLLGFRQDAAGTQVLARVFETGDTRTSTCPTAPLCVLAMPAAFRILLNGTSIGPIGPTARSARWCSETAPIRCRKDAALERHPDFRNH